MQSKKVLDYLIIKGLPENVEQEVQAHLRAGWKLNSELIPLKVDNYTIVAQCVVLYESEGEKQDDKTSKI